MTKVGEGVGWGGVSGLTTDTYKSSFPSRSRLSSNVISSSSFLLSFWNNFKKLKYNTNEIATALKAILNSYSIIASKFICKLCESSKYRITHMFMIEIDSQLIDNHAKNWPSSPWTWIFVAQQAHKILAFFNAKANLLHTHQKWQQIKNQR